MDTPDNLPAILDGKYFTLTSINKENSKVAAKCNNCPDKKGEKLIHGMLHSTTNFTVHLKVQLAILFQLLVMHDA